MSGSPSPLTKRIVTCAVLSALGAAAFILLQRHRRPPARRPVTAQGQPVRVLELERLDVIPRAVGYGIVEASRTWEMVAQVSGRVIEMNEVLAAGNIVPAGTALVRIDPEDYELAATRQRAGVDASRAQLQDLDAQASSARTMLELERRSLVIAERELERTRQLVAQDSASASELDATQAQVLAEERAIAELENTLRRIPASRRLLLAQAEQSEVGLAGAQLDVGRTTLVAPYDVRVREVRAELREVVGAGQILAVADGIDVAEVPAQLPIGALRPLLPFQPAVTPLSTEALSKLPELAAIEARIHLESSELAAGWDGRLVRFTTVDPRTRTVGVVVRVDEPLRGIDPGVRPPLVSGMYVEVELRGEPRPGCLAVPRPAVRGRTVYVVDADDRLQRREVTLDFSQREFVCVASGVTEGERLVLTDLVPAIEGMLLDPRDDPDARAAILSAAAGEESAG